MQAEVPPVPKIAPLAVYRTRRRWSSDDARAALAAWAASGLSQAAFARREGLDVQRLRMWKRKLGDVVGARAFVEVVSPRSQAPTPIDVILPSGIIVRVADTVDVVALDRIVEALASRC